MSTDAQEPDNTSASIPTETPAAPAAAPAQRRNSRMRRELLTKLPSLGFSSFTAADQFLVDEDLGTLDLTADAILAPLETLMGDKRTL